MKKFNITVSFFIFSLLAYLFYVIAIVFIKKNGYGSGIYYFTPVYLFSIYKLAASGIKRTWSVLIFTVIPFAISTYLSFRSYMPGWEVSGFIPVIVIMSYLFKTGKRGETPLKVVYMPKIIGVFLLAVLFFSVVHYVKTGSIESALHLAVSIYSPAPVAVAVAVFINFLITTATLSVVLNNLKFFNRGAVIKRFIFENDKFLTFPHLNLSGIETVSDISKKDFLDMVEKLNAVAEHSAEYTEILKKENLFSHKFEDGRVLAMGPLKTIISKGIYKKDGIPIPDKKDDRSFIALAQDDRIVGYYAIDRINPSTNAAFLEVFEKSHGIRSVVCSPEKPQIWKKSSEIVEKLEDVSVSSLDIIISEKETETKGVNLIWRGENYNLGDIFIAKPFLSTLLNLAVVSKEVKHRLIKGVIICSFPFAFSLFSISFGLRIPQIAVVSLSFSFVMTILYIFYFKSVNKRS